MNNPKVTNFNSGNKVRRCGQDLHKEERYNYEWPRMSGEVETRASRRARAAKLRCCDYGECPKTLDDGDYFQDVFDERLRGKVSTPGAGLTPMEDDKCRGKVSTPGAGLKTIEDDKRRGKVSTPGAGFKTLDGYNHFQDAIDEHLSLLTKDPAPERFVGAVSKEENGKYRIVEAVVDSGAEESVAPPGCFPGKVTPSKMSKAGGKYRAANGARIPNLGQQKVPFVNEAGDKCGIVFQVAEVERPLISATQMAAAGNSIVINGSGGKIVNDKSGKVMKLVRRGGVLVLRMRIPIEDGSGFPGQGR
jgi:hypothetical protein